MKSTLIYRHKWFNHFKIKCLSLICALILWFFIATDKYYEHTLNVSLNLINQPAEMILKDPVPSNVQVNFGGSGKELINLGFRNKYIEIDLDETKQTATIPITVNMITGIPTDVVPLNIVEPDSVRITLDRLAEKKVPIHPNIALIPLDGYIHVGSVIIDPDSINIWGPESLVNSVDQIDTEEKEYRNVIKEIQEKIDLIPPSFETVHYSLNKVHFTADIQRIGERIISDIPIQVTNAPQNVNVIVVPSTLSLRLQGGVKVLSNVDKEDIIARINYLSRNRYERTQIPAIVQVPPDISFSDVKPPFFELIVER
ncbi:YbbR-like domain-containing protein [bacterium]|nr:YbbR-like domain-containing protein [bacterium]